MRKIILPFVFIFFILFYCSKDKNDNEKSNYENYFRNADFVFAVYGETAGSNSIHKKITEKLSKQKIDMVFHTGNLIANPNKESEWEDFFTSLTPISNIIRHYYVCAGKNETDYIDELKLRFGNLSLLMKNEGFYSLTYKNSLFIVLNAHGPNQNIYKQQNYIIEILSNFITKINGPVFIFINKPIYSTGPSGVDQFLTRNLLILLEHFRITVIFSGQDKIYGRYKTSSSMNTTCIVTGGGSKKPDLCGNSHNEFEQYACHEKQHFILVAVKGNRIGIKAIGLDGNVFDTFETIVPSRQHTRKGIEGVYAPF